MGDRCQLSIDVHPDDIDQFLAIDEFEGPCFGPDKQDDGAMRIEYEEMNYGSTDDLADAAREGIRFVCHSGSGDDYPAAITVTMDETTLQAETTGARLVVPMDSETGLLISHELSNCLQVVDALAVFAASLKVRKDQP